MILVSGARGAALIDQDHGRRFSWPGALWPCRASCRSASPSLDRERLEHGAAELAERLGGLVGGHLLHHQEQRRGARLEQVGPGPGTRGRCQTAVTFPIRAPIPAPWPAEEWDERTASEQEPQNIPSLPRPRLGDGCCARGTCLFVADDARDGVGLDDQVLGQSTSLFCGQFRGLLVRVTDGDQVRRCPFPRLVMADLVTALRGGTAPPAAGEAGAIAPCGYRRVRPDRSAADGVERTGSNSSMVSACISSSVPDPAHGQPRPGLGGGTASTAPRKLA